MFDKKAKKILFDQYWKAGWKGKDAGASDAADIEYAKSKGFWFDPVIVQHDVIVEELVAHCKTLAPKRIGDSFLASLSSRRLELRSALGSYGYASNLPEHKILSSPRSLAPSGAEFCHICGEHSFPEPKLEDLNVLNFERHKWGGVRHGQALYAWFDLTRFESDEMLEPCQTDLDIMRQILEVASGLADDARPSALARALSGVVKSNEYERRVLIEVLSKSGILQPKNESGFFGEFTFAVDQRPGDEHSNDWGYPAVWWRGADGVNLTAVERYFPDVL